jgi:hypothetical protein
VRPVPEFTVSATKTGPGPLTYHVRDEEQRISALAHYRPAAVPEHVKRRHALRGFVVDIVLPPGAISQSVPDDTCAEWTCPDDGLLLVMIDVLPDRGLPGLESLRHWPADTHCLHVNHRPMALTLLAVEADGVWRATVEGYVDDTCPFSATVRASTPAGRDMLLAAVASFSAQRAESPMYTLWQHGRTIGYTVGQVDLHKPFQLSTELVLIEPLVVNGGLTQWVLPESYGGGVEHWHSQFGDQRATHLPSVNGPVHSETGDVCRPAREVEYVDDRVDPSEQLTIRDPGGLVIDAGAITISDHSSLLALFQAKLGYEGALPPLPLRLSAYFGEM